MTDWLDIPALAKMLGVGKKTAYGMVARREIPFYRVGKLIRFRRAEVEESMARRRVPAVGPDDAVRYFPRAKRMDEESVKKIVSGALEENVERDPVVGKSEKRAGAGPRKGEKP